MSSKEKTFNCLYCGKGYILTIRNDGRYLPGFCSDVCREKRKIENERPGQSFRDGQEWWCAKPRTKDCLVRFTLASPSQKLCTPCHMQKNRERKAKWSKEFYRSKFYDRELHRERNKKWTRLKRKSKGPFKMEDELSLEEVDENRWHDCSQYEECLEQAIKLRWKSFSCDCCNEWVEYAQETEYGELSIAQGYCS
jgi:hypothetical protein